MTFETPFKKWVKLLIPHLIAVLVFLIVAAVYFRPVFENKVLFQEDVLQWQGMARSSFQYKAVHGHFPLWTNSMFSGMPAYQIAMDDPQTFNIANLFFGIFTLYLKAPASYFFLACLCFYFLTRVLRINPYIGIIGGLAYAYATYNPVIIAVGHNTKMESIALLPAFIASLILIYEEKYWQGATGTALFTALLIATGHMQIVYYNFIIAVGLAMGYAVYLIRQKAWKRLRTATAIALGSGLIGVLCNALVLFTTYDSSTETIRGGSELANANSNYTQNGLSESLAFDFSMYKIEPFVMLVPKMFGGSTGPELTKENSKAMKALALMPPRLASQAQESFQYYWGGIGNFVSGPPYAGAIICFLALIGFLIVDNKHKWWILATFFVTIAMSWGGYFEGFNSFLLKFLPMYNKFRAPSMIIVIPTFLLCMMAMLSLQKILDASDRAMLWKKYKWGLVLMSGIFAVLLFLYHNFDYTTVTEQQLLKQAAANGSGAISQVQAFLNGLKEDRQGLFGNSLLRSFLFIVAAALALGFLVKKKVRPEFVLGLVGVLSFADVMGMDVEYLNHDNYQQAVEYQKNFEARPADKVILQDQDYYRVFDLRDSAANALNYGAMTAWFHHSIGGYHAAKLKIYEDLINYQLINYPACQPVINMLNTRYIILNTPSRNDSVVKNSGALGPVWFVNALQFMPGPQGVMQALTRFQPRDTAVLFEADRKTVLARLAEKPIHQPNGSANLPSRDTSAMIRLVKNDNDEILYTADAPTARFAVFSEIFYNRGWHAWVDDREMPIIRTNYVLRGLPIPAGHHIVRFAFRPQSYYLGRQMECMASILLILLFIASGFVGFQDWKTRIYRSESLPS